MENDAKASIRGTDSEGEPSDKLGYLTNPPPPCKVKGV